MNAAPHEIAIRSCPLCEAPAALFATPNFGRYRAINCETCGQFVVSDAADDRIRGLPHDFKDSWRATVKTAKVGEILLIIVEPVGSGGNLKVELVPRSSLRL